MNGSKSSSKEELDYTCEHEEAGIASDASPPPGGSAGDESKKVHFLARSASSEPSPKRSRRTVEKRVVTVRNNDAKGAGEGAPPADSWAWRKYGQKPIKGSPYPRGYYRCSSSKGCPARKQVERSRLDPATIMVTYSYDHNHPWPQPKSHHNKHIAAAAAVVAQPAEDPPEQSQPSPPESAEPEEKFSDLISEEESALLVHATQWFPQVCSTASTSPSAACSSEMLYGSVFFSGTDTATAATLPEEREDAGAVGGGGGGEEDSLFAGLGELPEYSVVLRRRFTSASWVGSMG